MISVAPVDLLQFELPDELAAHEPVEVHGLARDDVRLMVTEIGSDEIVRCAHFHEIADFFERGDLLVVNDSATIKASLPASRVVATDPHIRLHLSTQLESSRWAVELRHVTTKGSMPLLDATPGERLLLPGGVEAELIEPWPRRQDGHSRRACSRRSPGEACGLPR